MGCGRGRVRILSKTKKKIRQMVKSRTVVITDYICIVTLK